MPGLATTRGVDALLSLAKVSRDRPLTEVLEAVVQAVQASLGYATAVLNVYRPATHDYEAVVVAGDPAAQALEGTSNAYALFHEQLMTPAREQVPGAFFLPEGDASWETVDHYVPDHYEAVEGGWRPGDGLMVALEAADGRPLGVLSVDEPASGLRPTEAELQLLVAVCAHAALALENAEAAAESERHRRVLETLLRRGPELMAQETVEAVLDQVRTIAAETLRFGQVEIDAEDRVGWHPGRAGGPYAWGDARLAVPLRGGRAIVVADPYDGRVPTREREQELRLLAEQGSAALDAVEQRSRLAFHANHDALTGLRNRRGLPKALDALAPSGVAVLVADLDHFKRVNDTRGHEAGDRVLERFGALLAEHARASDLAVRLGGEEFCLVLPGADERGAELVARRLLDATPAATGGETVSIGIAVTAPGCRTAVALLSAADRALYAAKAGGRNRYALAPSSGTLTFATPS